MDAPPHPTVVLRMQLVSAAMLAGCLMFLGVLTFMRFSTEHTGGIPVVSYVALAIGLFSPLLARAVDRKLAAQPSEPSSKVDPAFQRHLVVYAVLEAAALVCGTMLAVAPDLLPLLGAAVPLGAMLLRFPRAS